MPRKRETIEVIIVLIMRVNRVHYRTWNSSVLTEERCQSLSLDGHRHLQCHLHRATVVAYCDYYLWYQQNQVSFCAGIILVFFCARVLNWERIPWGTTTHGGRTWNEAVAHSQLLLLWLPVVRLSRIDAGAVAPRLPTHPNYLVGFGAHKAFSDSQVP